MKIYSTVEYFIPFWNTIWRDFGREAGRESESFRQIKQLLRRHSPQSRCLNLLSLDRISDLVELDLSPLRWGGNAGR